MWIFLSDSFLSAVASHEPDMLLVRARHEGDIPAVFPSAEVVADAGTDYPYRALVSRTLVARAIADRVTSIDYPNFKATVQDEIRHKAYRNVWRNMREFGRRHSEEPQT